MSYPETLLRTAYDNHSIHNRGEIEKSGQCGCFSCMATFNAASIWSWISGHGKEDTAVCPYCDIDAVFGDAGDIPAVEQSFLRAVNKLIFGGPPYLDQTVDPHPISVGCEWSDDVGRLIYANGAGND